MLLYKFSIVNKLFFIFENWRYFFMEKLINNSMNRYFMYLRKSRKDEEAEAHGEGETLARHETILTETYKKMGILTDQVDIFKEIVSGETISARPVIQQIIDLVNQGVYTGGFVYEVERLARRRHHRSRYYCTNV